MTNNYDSKERIHKLVLRGTLIVYQIGNGVEFNDIYTMKFEEYMMYKYVKKNGVFGTYNGYKNTSNFPDNVIRKYKPTYCIEIHPIVLGRSKIVDNFEEDYNRKTESYEIIDEVGDEYDSKTKFVIFDKDYYKENLTCNIYKFCMKKRFMFLLDYLVNNYTTSFEIFIGENENHIKFNTFSHTDLFQFLFKLYKSCMYSLSPDPKIFNKNKKYIGIYIKIINSLLTVIGSDYFVRNLYSKEKEILNTGFYSNKVFYSPNFISKISDEYLCHKISLIPDFIAFHILLFTKHPCYSIKEEAKYYTIQFNDMIKKNVKMLLYAPEHLYNIGNNTLSSHNRMNFGLKKDIEKVLLGYLTNNIYLPNGIDVKRYYHSNFRINKYSKFIDKYNWYVYEKMRDIIIEIIDPVYLLDTIVKFRRNTKIVKTFNENYFLDYETKLRHLGYKSSHVRYNNPFCYINSYKIPDEFYYEETYLDEFKNRELMKFSDSDITSDPGDDYEYPLEDKNTYSDDDSNTDFNIINPYHYKYEDYNSVIYYDDINDSTNEEYNEDVHYEDVHYEEDDDD